MRHLSLINLTVVFFLLASPLHAHPVGSRESRARPQQVTLVQMQQAILDHVRSHKEDTIADVQVRLLEPEQPVTLPGGTLGMRVVAVSPAEGYGRQQFDVVLSVNGKALQTVKASADVTALADVVVSTNLIRIDETIQVEDVTIARTPMTTAPRQYAINLGEVIGKRAARPLAPHVPINVSTLAPPYLVRKGDRVTIEAKRGRLVIQTIGIMKAVGQAGQTVTVTNPESGKDIRAKVVGPGLVRVDF